MVQNNQEVNRKKKIKEEKKNMWTQLKIKKQRSKIKSVVNVIWRGKISQKKERKKCKINDLTLHLRELERKRKEAKKKKTSRK